MVVSLITTFWRTVTQRSPSKLQDVTPRTTQPGTDAPTARDATPTSSSNLNNVKPSLLSAEHGDGTRNSRDEAQVPIRGVTDATPEHAVEHIGMHPAQESLQSTSIVTPALLTDPPSAAKSSHPALPNADPAYADEVHDELFPSKAVDRLEEQAAASQELIADLRKVMSLRSEAQQKAKALRELLNEFSETASSIAAKLEQKTSDQEVTESTSLSRQVKTIPTLLRRFEVTRKAFDKSEERVSNLEWQIAEAEKRLHSIDSNFETPSLPSDASSDDPTDLPSVSVPISNNELDALGQPSQNVPLYERNSNNLNTVGDYSHLESAQLRLEPFGPESTTLHTGHNDVHDPSYTEKLAQSAIEVKTADNTHLALPIISVPNEHKRVSTASHQSPRYFVTPQATERLRRYGTLKDPEESGKAGAQFSDYTNTVSVRHSNDSLLQADALSQQMTHESALLGISSWLSNGTPWNSRNTSYQRRWRTFQIGMGFLQDCMIQNYEATSLGLPCCTPLSLIKNQPNDRTAATQDLLHAWLWEPTSHLEDTLNKDQVLLEDQSSNRAEVATGSRAPSLEAEVSAKAIAMSADLVLEVPNKSQDQIVLPDSVDPAVAEQRHAI